MTITPRIAFALHVATSWWLPGPLCGGDVECQECVYQVRRHTAVALREYDRAREAEMTVHVWGPPEDGALADDARLCTSPDAGQVVVHHVAPFRNHGDHWGCAECRFATTESHADAIDSMRPQGARHFIVCVWMCR